MEVIGRLSISRSRRQLALLLDPEVSL
jgi:hypothetical protein